jgi:hypothetical protein
VRVPLAVWTTHHIMSNTTGIVIGAAILFLACTRMSRRATRAASLGLDSWYKVLGFVAVIIALFIIISPEFLALGFLGDTAFFDLLVLLLSLQLQSILVQARSWVADQVTKVICWMLAPRTIYLLFLATLITIQDLVSATARWVQRFSS